MGKKVMSFVSVLGVLAFVLGACTPKPAAEGPVVIRLWTKEGEADGGFQYVKALTDAFTAANPTITF